MAINIYELNEDSKVPGITAIPTIFDLQDAAPSVPPRPIGSFAARLDSSDTVGLNIGLVRGSFAGILTDTALSATLCENVAVYNDLYNFGYSLQIVGTDTILTRTEYFGYYDSTLNYVLSGTQDNRYWTLYDTALDTMYYNYSTSPAGTYTGLTTLQLIYV